jgi:integrase
MGSMKGQVTYSLNALQAFGHSRREALANGTAADKIFGIRTMQQYCELNVTFAEWCRARFGTRRLCDITPEMTAGFVAELKAKGRSPATVAAYVSAIKKLDVGLRAVGWRRRKAEPLVPDFHGRRADIVADPYTPDDAQRLIVALAAVDPQYGQVARLQRVSGLRVSEAIHLQADCIAPDGSHIVLTGPGTHTKGGRPRVAVVLPQHRPVVVALREQGLTNSDGHVFQNRQSLTGAVKRAASRLAVKLGIEVGDGTHSLRKLYANELYGHLLNTDGLSRERARRAVTQALGHNRLDVLKAYLVEDPMEPERHDDSGR